MGLDVGDGDQDDIQPHAEDGGLQHAGALEATQGTLVLCQLEKAGGTFLGKGVRCAKAERHPFR